MYKILCFTQTGITTVIKRTAVRENGSASWKPNRGLHPVETPGTSPRYSIEGVQTMLSIRPPLCRETRDSRTSEESLFFQFAL